MLWSALSLLCFVFFFTGEQEMTVEALEELMLETDEAQAMANVRSRTASLVSYGQSCQCVARLYNVMLLFATGDQPDHRWQLDA